MQAIRKYLFYLLLFVGSALVLYLSWRSTPKMATVWFIPHSLALWADQNQHDTIRTAVPFVGLGSLVGGQLAWQKRPWHWWLLAWVVLTGLVVLAEVGQLFLRHRSCDVGDIGWGIMGGLAGLSGAAILKSLFLAGKQVMSEKLNLR